MNLQIADKLATILQPFGGLEQVHKNGKDSYCLYKQTSVQEDIKDSIMKFFAVSDKDKQKFDEAFRQAVSGDGNELLRIATLHSSALLPLMTFYKVDKDNPVEIDGISYDRVFFEVKNKVFRGGPSNIDVALYSSDEKVLLFLESKFTELLDIRTPEVSMAYHNWLTAVGMEVDASGNYSHKDFHDVYYYGIKQMIAHFIGLLNGPINDSRSEHTDRENYPELFKKTDARIILGSIIYDADDYFYNNEEKNLINNYKALYNTCIKELAKIERDDCIGLGIKPANAARRDRIEIKPVVLTYQDVFSATQNAEFLDEKVKQFYALNQ